MKKAPVAVSRRLVKRVPQVSKTATGSATATIANATYTGLCWHIGRRLLRDNLQDGRAARRVRRDW